VWSSNNLDRLGNFPAAEQNLLVGLRYLALDRVFERARIASLVDGPLPKVSAEQLARLVFESEPFAPPPLEGDLVLARFAG
jgi:hypothetical protein